MKPSLKTKLEKIIAIQEKQLEEGTWSEKEMDKLIALRIQAAKQVFKEHKELFYSLMDANMLTLVYSQGNKFAEIRPVDITFITEDSGEIVLQAGEGDVVSNTPKMPTLK